MRNRKEENINGSSASVCQRWLWAISCLSQSDPRLKSKKLDMTKGRIISPLQE